ncbi:MAG: PspC domain-containing protein [bacterium]
MEKKLFRSRKDRIAGGVAAGLGEYLGIDPIIVRIIFVILTITHGMGVLLYIILWIVIPEAPFDYTYFPNTPKEDKPGVAEESKTGEPFIPPVKKNTGHLVFGVILIGLGIIFLMDRFIPYFDYKDILPIGLVIVGGILIINSFRK